MPQHVMPSIQTGGSYPEGPDRCSGWDGYRLVGGEQLYCASLRFIAFFPFSPFSFIFSPLVISLIIIIIGGSSCSFVLYLSYWTVLISTCGIYILMILLPSPPGVGGEGRRRRVSKRLRGSEAPARLKP